MGDSTSESSLAQPGQESAAHKATRYRKRYRLAQAIVVVLFGAIIPTVLLTLAAIGLTDLQRSLTPAAGEFAATLESTQKTVSQAGDANSYVLAAFVFSEHSNRTVITTKTRLKIGVVQIGFSVMSVGIMFLLLGIKDGGLDATMSGGDLKFDFKTGSTGLATFVIGALMAAGGGLLKNDYTTVGVPSFSASGGGFSSSDFRAILDDCKKLPENQIATCFVKSLE